MKRKKTTNKVIIAGISIFFFALFLLLPPAGDDFCFMVKPLNSFADFWHAVTQDYLTQNGRIIGNMLSYLLTRAPIISSLVKTVIVIGIFYNVMALLEKRLGNMFLTLLGIALIVLLPLPIFLQTYAWNAGFYNYVPPVLILLFVFRKIVAIFDGKEDSKFTTLIMLFFSGILVCLFIEFCTTYTLAFCIIMFIAYIWKYRKISKTILCYFCGNVIGTALMFSSPVYHNVANSTDQYRTMALSFSSIINQAGANFEVVSTNTIGGNFLLTILLSTVCAVIVLHASSGYVEKMITVVLTCVPIYYILSRIVLTPNFSISTSIMAIVIDFVVCIVYFLCIVYCIAVYVSNVKKRYICLLLIFSVLVLNLPLLVVTPIGPRCFFGSYILLVALVLQLAEHIMVDLKQVDLKNMELPLAMCIVSSMAALLFIGYHQTEVYQERCEYIEAEMKDHIQPITVPQYEYPNFIHEPETQKIGYKYYYKEPWDIEWNYIPYKEWYVNYYKAK